VLAREHERQLDLIAIDLHRGLPRVLLDDGEEVRQKLALRVGQVGALDQRDLVLDGIDGLARNGRLGRAARLAPLGLGCVVVLGLLGLPGLGLQAARAVALVRNRNPSS